MLLTEPQSRHELLGESFGHAVVDSGCNKTVCGRIWFDEYVSSLPRSETLKIESKLDTRRFRFGDGDIFTSTKLYTIPIMVGSKPVKLDTHIVDADIPLLLSRESLKKAEADIDFQKDVLNLFGEKINLKTSKSGHLMFPLTDYTAECFLTSPIQPDDDNLKKQITKLHKQFAHPAPNRLKKLIKNSGTDKQIVDEMIDKITNECDTCKRFKKAPPRPVVGMPLASEFNETVAMDIKFISLTTLQDIVLQAD